MKPFRRTSSDADCFPEKWSEEGHGSQRFDTPPKEGEAFVSSGERAFRAPASQRFNAGHHTESLLQHLASPM